MNMLASALGLSALVLLVSVANSQEIGQPGSFPLASCKGWSATLTELKRKDTDRATMRGVLTSADAKEYCERDPGGVTVAYGGKKTVADCIVDVLNGARSSVPPQITVSATADCKRGIIDSASEKRYQLVGIERHSSGAELTWKHIRSGAILGQSCGEGTPPITEQFRIMCPAAAAVGIKSRRGAASDLESGWWVILGSIDVSSDYIVTSTVLQKQQVIEAAANRCGFKAFTDFSMKFAGMAPGYNILVLGPRNERLEAEKIAQSVRRCVPDAYVKRTSYAGE